MAITDVVVPQLSESVSEATLMTWKKKPGDAIVADEILIEIETDKVVMEVPAPASGVLAEIVKVDGSMVSSGEVLAKIDTEGKASAAPAAAAAAPAATPVTAPVLSALACALSAVALFDLTA
jgi:2-oxoglutarate dehydrogenase E2 component (dihydrolipoamide succinyltransferase)